MLVAAQALMLGIYVGLLAGTVWLVQTTSAGFIPTLDRGYAIVVMQLPDGASL